MTTQAAQRVQSEPRGDTSTEQLPPARARRRWHRPSTARTRIIGWVLLLVLASLGVVTLVTWRLLVQATDERMERALVTEVQEFQTITENGVSPRDDTSFDSVDAVLEAAIAYNQARPNEKFLGYVNGEFVYQSNRTDGSPPVLQGDRAFAALVAEASDTGFGIIRSYDSAAGEVLYLSVPIDFPADVNRGVIVAAYFADAERRAADETAQVMLGVGAITSLGAAVGAWIVAGRILRPLRDVADTARSITETDLSRRIPTDPSRPADGDELHDLVGTVNAMLDRVETGVAEQRRFVDDAGHELRTPITIVRGHLEVLDPADPADVESTLELVDDELGRMNRMVSDLLLLARSEQPTFLCPDATDVGELTDDVFDNVVRLGHREWRLETVARTPAVLDRQRVTQAIIALADNAVRYTNPGDRIAIGSQLAGGRLRFWVSDSGPGVGDTVAGLEGGADDYMPKPFRFEELLARVRLRLNTERSPELTVLSHGGLQLDLRTRRAQVGDRTIDLSAREFALAETFLRHPGQVLSREQLLSHVWGYDFDPGSNVVDVYVRYLRRKLGAERIVTVRGMGYRLDELT